MSMPSKKQLTNNEKTGNAIIPPRYQNPPIPNTQNHNKTNVVQNVKDGKNFHQKVNENGKVYPPSSIELGKYYPHPASLKYPPYPPYYPPNSSKNPEDVRNQLQQVQIHHEPSTNGNNNNNRLRPFDEPGIPQIHPSNDPRLFAQQRQPIIRSEEEFSRPEMLKFVRKPEHDPRLITTTAAQNHHIQNTIAEIRALKEANQRLADDNQELRDLCCFLDDDRQKGRKLAREWQRFGRYTASVMRQEVSAYQNKLRELDNKQQELIKDNLELKELCLYLDEERANNIVCPNCGIANVPAGNLRDDGDGSSSSTNADEPNGLTTQFNGGNTTLRRTASRERLLHENLARQRSTFNDQIMQYVRNLEQRVKELEDDKSSLTHKINQIATSTGDPSLAIPTDTSVGGGLSGRPEAVVRALQVLEVREQLEREERLPNEVTENGAPELDAGEKALVREMCNVVWRKLEEVPVARR